MWAIVRRAVLPGLLLIGGLGSLIYGAMFHKASVVEERETETTIDVPLGLPPARPFGEMSPPGMPPFPGGAPMDAAPAVIKKKVKRVDRVTVEMSEPSMIRDVTVGGLALSKSGELERTYSGDAGPAMCPT